VPRSYDAVVVGSGPNGLAAAIVIAETGRSVLVIEAADTIGGGCRTGELTLPGFLHDTCSAIHPMALASPLFRRLPLERHGLRWVHPPAPLAHPFEDGTAVVLHRSIAETAAQLADDGPAWIRLLQPLVDAADATFDGLLRPAGRGRPTLALVRFGLLGLRSCASLVRSRFRHARARALFAGCAAHSFLPLEAAGSASFGLVLTLAGHAVGWPCAHGGSGRIADALAAHLRSLGGEIEVGRPVRSLAELPPARAVLFDVAPIALCRIAGDALPARYRRQLARFVHGPGAFKIDWALAGPIPWTANSCAAAGTVHVGGSFEEVAASEAAACAGRVPMRPFVIVAQQSMFDPVRAPRGRQAAWGYCHVPNGCPIDMTDRIEQQIERFAPGFRDLILCRRITPPRALEAANPNLVGGDISGGANHLRQLVFRPAVRWNPYATPNPRLFLCSASTPPGGGVHGMCGAGAALSALATVLASKEATVA
jgi:phytoene dehydrogenase-like protein